jgi:hypothetical protein
MNDTKNDLEGMGRSVIAAAVGPQNGFEPQVASQNPRQIKSKSKVKLLININV